MMIHRRRFLEIAAVVGAALALTPPVLRAQQQQGSALMQRTIPSTGEKVPAIQLAFSNHPGCADHAALTEVMRVFAEGGGKAIDMTLGNAANQRFHMTAAKQLGISDKVFWSTTAFVPGPPPNPPQPAAAVVKRQLDSVLTTLNVPRVDLAWLTVNSAPEMLPALMEEKKAGRVRYIGAYTIVTKQQAPQLEELMRGGQIDFIGIEYDIGNRFAEESILPLALERKIGVVAFFPFSNNSGFSCGGPVTRNLFSRVGEKPLPAWAAEFDAKSWAQFFIKYVLSHPAVTFARVGTTKPHHMQDNLGGAIGRLPNEATRKRMAALVDSLPPPPPLPPNPAAAPGIAVATAILDRYVGEYKAATGFTAIFRRDGDKLFVKPGNNPEAPMNARTETRFQDPRGPIFEFQVDAQGKVTGAILEQGTQKISLQRQ